jgi:hypothetical protein
MKFRERGVLSSHGFWPSTFYLCANQQILFFCDLNTSSGLLKRQIRSNEIKELGWGAKEKKSNENDWFQV